MHDSPPLDYDFADQVLICPTCLTANATHSDRCGSCIRKLRDLEPVPVHMAETVRAEQLRRRRRRFRTKIAIIGLVLIVLAMWQTFEFYGFVRFMSPPASKVSAMPSSSESPEWPMLQRDPNHSGYQPNGELMPAGQVLWSFDFGTEISTSPAVVGGIVYMGAGRRGIVALDAETGEELWQFPVAGEMETSVAVAGERVFAGLRDGRIIALDRRTGELDWFVQTANKIFSSPAVLNGNVYVGSGDSFLYVIDAETGGVRWKYDAGDSIVSAPAVNEEVLAFTAQDRKLYVVEPFSGRLRFDYRLDYVAGSPTILGDRVYVGDESGILRSIDWHQRTLPFERAFVKLRFYGWWYGLTTLENQKGFVWGFSSPGSSPLGTPVATDELIYVPAAIGRLYAVDAITGEEVWSFRTAGGLISAPSVIGDTVLIGDKRGRLYGLTASTGELIWELRGFTGAIASTPVVAGKTIYVVTTRGSLVAIR